MRKLGALIIVALIVSLLGSLNGVNAYKNSTCLDASTLQVNTSSEEFVATDSGSSWFNDSKIELFDCSLGCSTIDGAKCREVVQGAFPIEIFIFLQILAFFFMVNSFPFRSAIRKSQEMSEYGYEEIVWPILSALFFFVCAFISLMVFTPSTGQMFISSALFNLNNFLGWIMVVVTLFFSFNIWNHMMDTKHGRFED